MAERDAIWSAAVHAYRAGEPNYLPPELANQVSRENEAYQLDSPWMPAVQEWLTKLIAGDAITTERILSQAIAKPIERQTRADQMAVADILRRLGYERRRTMANGQRCWRWYSAG
jgi:predicted P-loop ATPase